ncbi:MAG TPA: heme-binding domain-containing protein [Blastocatellia bacterium]|nr:heme-binding domain-containing protein [Blastocatellia bacterium]
MKLNMIWLAAALGAGILVASLVPGPFNTVTRVRPGGAGFLQSAQLDPVAVATIRRACGNCHSNETAWPWYSRVAPASWLLRKDVSDGRKFLNFSVWPEYGIEGQGQLLALAARDLKRGSMPPRRYSAIHADARSSPRERTDLIAALEGESARLLETERSNHSPESTSSRGVR